MATASEREGGPLEEVDTSCRMADGVIQNFLKVEMTINSKTDTILGKTVT